MTAAARVVRNYNLRDSRDACDSDVIQTCVSVLLPKIHVQSPRSTVGPDPDTYAGTISHITQSSYSSPSGLHQLSSHAPQPTRGIHRSSRQTIPQQQQQLRARHCKLHCATCKEPSRLLSVTSGGWEQVPVDEEEFTKQSQHKNSRKRYNFEKLLKPIEGTNCVLY